MDKVKQTTSALVVVFGSLCGMRLDTDRGYKYHIISQSSTPGRSLTTSEADHQQISLLSVGLLLILTTIG